VKADGQAAKNKDPVAFKENRKQEKQEKKDRKDAAKAKALTKPDYVSHDDKMRQNAAGKKVQWSDQAAERLDKMGVKGAERKEAKKFHKDVVKNHMKDMVSNPLAKEEEKPSGARIG
jgi:hypothetical protein